MLIAITRGVSPSIANCALSYIERQPIDFALACRQHCAYRDLLTSLGAAVVPLPPEPDLPDSMFVEDPAIVLDEFAIVFPLGTESRRREAESVAIAISQFRAIERVSLPGTVEGGDVLRIGRRLFVGLTRRTNPEGMQQLHDLVGRFGYEVIPVKVTGCLHLKSAVTFLGNTLLANRRWFDASAFSGFDWIDVDPREPHAGNALELNGTVVFPASFPHTHELIASRGFQVAALDISELQKAESGMTCSSLIFEAL